MLYNTIPYQLPTTIILLAHHIFIHYLVSIPYPPLRTPYMYMSILPHPTPAPAVPQMGGLIVNYAHNLSFATVHGAGHMVPQFQPAAALTMLTEFLGGDSQVEQVTVV